MGRVFSFTFWCEETTSPAAVWHAFHQAFVGRRIDPISIYYNQEPGSKRAVIPGSAPASECLPDIPMRLSRPDLGLLTLLNRSHWLDVSQVASPVYTQVERALSAGDTLVELMGPVRLVVPSEKGLVEEWFYGQQSSVPIDPVFRDYVLWVRLWVMSDQHRAILMLSSHTDVWWHLGLYQHGDTNRDDADAILASKTNVQSLARAAWDFLAALPTARRSWTENDDLERPDMGHLMRPVLHRMFGPPDQPISEQRFRDHP